MINIVCFSKNRAAQLDALIRSFLENFQGNDYNMTVIYKATTPEFEQGYSKVKSTYGNIVFQKESNFKNDVLKAIDSNNDLTMFLVDDILFKDRWSLNDKEIQLVKNNKEILATSLRLYNGITHCYATNSTSALPNFIKGCIWLWRGCSGDFGYGLSVDGDIFRTNFILENIKGLNFNNPNTFEASLNSIQNCGNYKCCYVSGAKLINIPANIVQNQYKNRVGNLISCEELNEKFLGGQIISLETVKKEEAIRNKTVHLEIEYEWI